MERLRRGLWLPLVLASLLEISPAFAQQTSPSCFLSLLKDRLQHLIQQAVDTGYANLDGTRFTLQVGNKEFAGLFERFEPHPQYRFSDSVRDRGALRLVFKAKNPGEAVEIYADIFDLFLQETPIFRNGHIPSPRRVKSERIESIALSGGAGSGDVIVHNGRVENTSRIEAFHHIYSQIDLDGSLVEHPIYFGPGASDHLRAEHLGIVGDEYLFIVKPHMGRSESENSERLIRALFRAGQIRLPSN